MKWIRRILITLGVLVLAVAVAGAWLVRRSFPDIDGEATLPGLDSPVTVTRDVDGIPHIEATSAHDLFMAQGYVEAQDRFWQMDAWRHIGAGRLAELFGESQVETDMFLRTLGFERIAAQEYELASPEVTEALDAYAQGVNAYLTERAGSALSLEYAVIGLQNRSYEPEPWEPIDTLMWGHVMAWDLRANMDDEISRALLAGVVGRDRVEQLYPSYPQDHSVIVPSTVDADATEQLEPALTAAIPALERLDAALAGLEQSIGRHVIGTGSNNWVIGGANTESGSPLLANDPHLGIQMPSIWYEVDLWCVEITADCPYRVAGFGFPGTPGVVVGHNERIAWGVTNLAPDAMDLYVIDSDGTSYAYDDERRDIDVRTETIGVAGGADVELEVRSTHHGPIISGVFGALDDIDTGGIEIPDEYEIALRWQALEPATLFESLIGINRATNWEEFRASASFFDIAAQNLVYADVDGHIGYQATGEIPVRRSGDGRYPAPGWSSEYEWDGLIPFDDLPRLFDPPDGYIVTANQPVVDAGYEGFIGIDHAYGYRSDRINDLLRARSDWAVEDMIDVQMDDYAAFAEILVPAFLSTESDDPAVGEVQTALQTWGEGDSPFEMDTDSAGAAAFASAWRHLLSATFDDELAEYEMEPSGRDRYMVAVEDLLSAPEDTWWDDQTTAEVERAPVILESALAQAYAELVDRMGEDPADWRWGDLHRARFENQTVGQSGIAPIDALFNRTAPPEVSGGTDMVNATSWLAFEGYEVAAVPSFRMAVDLADLAASLAINTTGQSGHAFSGHYFDMVDRWSTGGTHPLRFGPASVGDPSGVLRLTP